MSAIVAAHERRCCDERSHPAGFADSSDDIRSSNRKDPKWLDRVWLDTCLYHTDGKFWYDRRPDCKDAICLIGICLPVFLLHAIGAGDIKLWSVIAAMHGLAVTWQIAVVFFAIAGSCSLIRMFQQKIFVERFYYLVHFVHICMNRRCNEPYETADGTELRYYDKQRDGTGCAIKLAPFTMIAYVVVLTGRWTGQC